MPRIEVDLTTVPSLGNLPDGVYIVKIVNYSMKKSQAGNDKILWETQVLAPEEIVAQRPKWFFDTVLSPNAMWKVKDLFEACGRLKEGFFEPEDLFGAEVGIVVVNEDYEGSMRNRIKKFLPAAKTTPIVEGEIE